MKKKQQYEEFHCNFCGRDKAEAMILVAGLEAHICEVCVEQAQGIIQQELYGKEPKKEKEKRKKG